MVSNSIHRYKSIFKERQDFWYTLLNQLSTTSRYYVFRITSEELHITQPCLWYTHKALSLIHTQHSPVFVTNTTESYLWYTHNTALSLLNTTHWPGLLHTQRTDCLCYTHSTDWLCYTQNTALSLLHTQHTDCLCYTNNALTCLCCAGRVFAYVLQLVDAPDT